MKGTTAVTLLLVVGLTGRTEAANLAVIASPPTLMNLVVLGLAVAAIVIGIPLLRVIKGGYLCRPWQLFIAGFGVLALAQFLGLLRTLEIAAIPMWLTAALMAVSVGAFFYGVFETKKVLS
jgi:predicted membrane channel-forming protein YqfA (hemolysin III family)